MTRFEHTRFIFDKIRQQVSADRNRFEDEDLGISLDLSYITDNIIAMAVPSSGIDGIYRNHIKDVEDFLKTNHPGKFMVWNLSEKEYNEEKFDNQVQHLEFPDHHPPPLELLFKILNGIDNWLRSDPANVAVVHCVGGKGRTGTVIVCYLYYSGICKTVKEAQQLFAKKRSSLERGVTQPSQKRYTEYFKTMLVADKQLNFEPIHLVQVALTPMPPNKTFGLEVFDSVNNGKLIYAGWHHPLTPTDFPLIKFKIRQDVRGDLYFRLMKQKKTTKRVVKEFHVVLHTFFIDTIQVELKKHELDTISEKSYSDDLTVTFTFGPAVNPAPPYEMDPIMERMVQDFRTRQNIKVPDYSGAAHPLQRAGYAALREKAKGAHLDGKKPKPQPSVWTPAMKTTTTLQQKPLSASSSAIPSPSSTAPASPSPSKLSRPRSGPSLASSSTIEKPPVSSASSPMYPGSPASVSPVVSPNSSISNYQTLFSMAYTLPPPEAGTSSNANVAQGTTPTAAQQSSTSISGEELLQKLLAMAPPPEPIPLQMFKAPGAPQTNNPAKPPT